MEYAEWFCHRLAELRMQKGVSARDMSLSLGQSESYINKIENRRTLPSMTGFFYICDYLEITPQEFFSQDNLKPMQVNEVVEEWNRLPNEIADHLLQVIKELNRK